MKSIRRRRLEAKTDYKLRLEILKAGKARLVVRKTNKYIIAQIVQTELAQDKVIAGVNSKDLLEKGWPKESAGSLKSLAAAYVTGFLIGKTAVSKKITEALFDMGMNRNIHKSRIYAVLKGAIDAGMNIPHSEEALPSLDEVKKNKELASLIAKLTK